MKKLKRLKFIHAILIAFSSMGYPTLAQKNIVISENLAVNSEQMSVKMGTQWMGKIWNIRFGEYAVVSSKLGWLTTTSRSNVFNVTTETTSSEKFSFVLNNKTSDSARVNAGTDIMEEWKTVIETNIDVSLENILDALLSTGPFSSYVEGASFVSLSRKIKLSESSNFSAFITINGDTTETWTLSMVIAKGRQTPINYDGFLTNGKREIFLARVNSNKNGQDKRSIPALGYEFIENGQSLSALQYYGGGAFGMNKNIIWLGNENDSKMKLVLGAALTALLQISWNKME